MEKVEVYGRFQEAICEVFGKRTVQTVTRNLVNGMPVEFKETRYKLSVPLVRTYETFPESFSVSLSGKELHRTPFTEGYGDGKDTPFNCYIRKMTNALNNQIQRDLEPKQMVLFQS